MGRATIRTQTVSLDVINPMRTLFGTIKNAHQRLGLSGTVDYASFYRAMHFKPVTPEHRDAIEEAWTTWRSMFIDEDVSEATDFTLLTDGATA